MKLYGLTVVKFLDNRKYLYVSSMPVDVRDTKARHDVIAFAKRVRFAFT